MYDEIILISVGLLIIYLAIFQLKSEIRRLNITLDKIAEKLGVPEPAEDSQIKAFIAEGNKNKAIKRYREITGVGLKEAYDYIEKIISDNRDINK
ncbi:MAG TPA: 50S ribosomal protein L7/L12 [Acetivibrio sp.]|nr:50S ribosomal protein L7/L12 [Acetivibrio sp.]HPT90617.1 50S ribosomal protein L7/L12 [Acetivibrio sp.]